MFSRYEYNCWISTLIIKCGTCIGGGDRAAGRRDPAGRVPGVGAEEEATAAATRAAAHTEQGARAARVPLRDVSAAREGGAPQGQGRGRRTRSRDARLGRLLREGCP